MISISRRMTAPNTDIARDADHALDASVEHDRQIDAVLHAARGIVRPDRERVEPVFDELPRALVHGADARLVRACEDHAGVFDDVDVAADRALHFRNDAHGVLRGKVHSVIPSFCNYQKIYSIYLKHLQ